MAVVRNQAVELLRIASAFGIVWFHGGATGSEYAGGGLIVFVILSTLFVSGRDGPSPKALTLLRFLIPWAIWMAIYGLLNLVRGIPIVPLDNGLIPGVLMGSSIHLWFLPFITAIIAIIVLAKRAMPALVLGAVATACLAIVMITFPWWYPWSWTAGVPFTQYVHVLPAVLAGTILGAIRFPDRNRLWGLAIVITVALIALLPAKGAISYGIGMIAVAIAMMPLARQWASRWDVTPISRAMFGVYLVHPLALYPTWRFIGAGYGVLAVTAAFLLSLCAVLLTRRVSPQVSSVLFAY
ncbi:MAG: hypothetical protein P0Y65_08945 [Candidatus Devosia phytovorans]|uniref:Acyltransferase 3 domain-containing protein n=1 Tax=Candidatus Devosia phytovorans TaxID=3121372 RepID=A0AAJ5VWU3_9HYPH|nr:acyltransferase family protein [Devosia sp.]WEK06356.1 MAG: hypothetical protein P0Y65_08945 [Devosia sp.]